MPHEVVSLFPEGIIINLYLLSSVSSSFEIYYIFGDHLELQTKKYFNLTIENIPKLHVARTKAYIYDQLYISEFSGNYLYVGLFENPSYWQI